MDQLRYWDRTRFFVPSYADENRRLPYSRIYSFKDIAALRVIGILRNQNSVSLQHLREVAVELRKLSDDGWTKTKLYVLKKKVVFDDPETGGLREVVGGQYVVPSVILGTVLADTEQDVSHLTVRPAEKIGKIDKNRYVSHNRPVIAGTRIPTSAIKSFNDAGYTVDEIIEEYPDLTPEDVKAALDYEADAAA